uniref:Uncharacterized protein n=1 Tax=Cacopsylla melanoneura TaxID=428564 RepID=A0A8D8WU84_9HEMI
MSIKHQLRYLGLKMLTTQTVNGNINNYELLYKIVVAIFLPLRHFFSFALFLVQFFQFDLLFFYNKYIRCTIAMYLSTISAFYIFDILTRINFTFTSPKIVNKYSNVIESN